MGPLTSVRVRVYITDTRVREHERPCIIMVVATEGVGSVHRARRGKSPARGQTASGS